MNEIKKKVILCFLLILIAVISIACSENESIFNRSYNIEVIIDGVQEQEHVSAFKIRDGAGSITSFKQEHFDGKTLRREISIEQETKLTLVVDNSEILDPEGIYKPETKIQTVDRFDSEVKFELDFQTEFSLNIILNGQGQITPTPDKNYYKYNEEVTITATPENRFIEWRIGDINIVNNSTTIIIDNDLDIEAVFERAISFKDPNLEESIRDTLEIKEGNIYHSDFMGITSLNLSRKNIYNLTGLEEANLSNLEVLDLSSNQISDISILAEVDLSNLRRLRLSGNNISDISVLEGVNLSNLEVLCLVLNQISDISVLAAVDLSNLEKLDLFQNQILEISVLSEADLSNLRSLNLDDNLISDISVLAEADLSNLDTLRLRNNEISNITSLKKANFKNIGLLKLSVNNISDISVLAETDFKKLSVLDLRDNNISDITVIAEADLSNLDLLCLKDNKISDLRVLAGADLSNLRTLFLSNNNITDLEGLQYVNFNKGLQINARGNEIANYKNIIDELMNIGVHVYF
ncbi:leucine-rich repeat domain-containing protein [Natronospora cellulosivora (SeqCode)]